MSRVARATLIIAFFFALEKALGFIRQVAIARTFGLSAELDAFNVANNIPDLIFALISGGALGIALIPVLSEFREEQGRAALWELFSRIANLFFLATAICSIIVAVLASQIVNWRLGVAPGFDAVQKALVVDLMRLDLIATLFLSLGGLVIAGLQSNQHFLLPAMAPAMYDLGTLFGIFILAPQQGLQIGPVTLPAYGLGIYGLAYGTILGTVLFLLIQVPGLIRYQFRWKPIIGLHNPGVQKVLTLLGPRLVTVFFIQFTFLAQDNIASRLATGSVAALVYGWLFMQVPETMIGTAIGTALLPTLSEDIANQRIEAYRSAMNQTIRVILALTIPGAILLGLALPAVVSILGFDAAGTDLVVRTSRAYLLGLVGHSLLEVAVRAFYSRQDARTPMITAGVTTVVFILLVIPLGFRFGAPGIALANSLAFTGQALLLLFLLNRKVGGLWQVGNTLLRVAAATVLSAALMFLLLQAPLPGLPLAVGSLLLAGCLVIPFIWPELRLLIRLGGTPKPSQALP